MRLVDADALPRHKQLEAMGNGKYEDVEVVYANDIYNAPTIDAVPVVRCKDCKWRNTIGCDAFVAAQSVYACEDDGFCKWAERKDDE